MAAKPKFKFESVPGAFLQDEPDTDWQTFKYVCTCARPRVRPGADM